MDDINRKVDAKLKRLTFLGEAFKEKIFERGMSVLEASGKVNKGQSYVSTVLNGSKMANDLFFIELGKAIGLSNKEIEKILEEADYIYFTEKYGENFFSRKTLTYEDIFSAMKEKEDFSPKQMEAIQEFIEFQKNKKNE